jgi:hypothetical protein
MPDDDKSEHQNRKPNIALSAMPSSSRCEICLKTFLNEHRVKQHIVNSTFCRKEWELRNISENTAPRPPHDTNDIDPPSYDMDIDGTHPLDIPANSPNPRRRVHVEEVEDKDTPAKRYALPYPGRAAESLGIGKTNFEGLLDQQKEARVSPFYPFVDKEEWGLASWMMKEVSQGACERFLKLPIVRFSEHWPN